MLHVSHESLVQKKKTGNLKGKLIIEFEKLEHMRKIYNIKQNSGIYFLFYPCSGAVYDSGVQV